MEIFVFAVLGLLGGIIAGLLPGIGTGAVMVLMYLVLVNVSLEAVIIFFIGIVVSAQYLGSVIAIMTGIPGDPASIPASKWGFSAAKQGFGSELLFQTAKYSLLSGLVSFCVVLLLVVTGWHWAKMLGVAVESFLIFFAVVGVAFFSQNSLWKNLLLVVAGAVIGSVGWTGNFQNYFWVAGDSVFSHGIPWVSIITGLMVIPGLLTLLNPVKILDEVGNNNSNTTYSRVAMRSGIVGFILGTVPGISYILSSIVAAKLEQRSSNDPLKITVASETANNAGVSGMMIPFFVLGIPITISESIIFNIMLGQTNLGGINGIFRDHWSIYLVYFVILNLILFLISWKVAIPLCHYLFANKKIVLVLGMIMCIGGLFWYAHTMYLWIPVLLSVALSLPVGLMFRQVDWSPLIFAVILYEYVEGSVYKILQFYF